MPDHQKMYLLMFNAVTDAIGQLQKKNGTQAILILQKAQTEAEEIYMETDE